MSTGNALCESKTNHIMERDGFYKVGYVLMNGDGSRVCLSAQGAVTWLTKEQYWWLMHDRDHIEFEWPKPLGGARPASIPDALESRRSQHGWTQAKMAKTLGLRPGHYSEIIHGKRGLPIQATRLAYSIGVPAAVLLALPTTPKRSKS